MAAVYLIDNVARGVLAMSTASSHLDIPAIRTKKQIHLFIIYVTYSQKVCYSNKEETVRPLL